MLGSPFSPLSTALPPPRRPAEKPKLSPTNTRALTRMKQTLRKHNAAYAEQMRLFRCVLQWARRGGRDAMPISSHRIRCSMHACRGWHALHAGFVDRDSAVSHSTHRACLLPTCRRENPVSETEEEEPSPSDSESQGALLLGGQTGGRAAPSSCLLPMLCCIR